MRADTIKIRHRNNLDWFITTIKPLRKAKSKVDEKTWKKQYVMKNWQQWCSSWLFDWLVGCLFGFTECVPASLLILQPSSVTLSIYPYKGGDILVTTLNFIWLCDSSSEDVDMASLRSLPNSLLAVVVIIY